MAAGKPRGARISRPDGKGPTMPNADENRTPRPNRYVLMEFTNPLAGKEADFEKASNQQIQEILKIPGWMAVQRFRMADTPGRAPGSKPKYLNIWETEEVSAQAVNDALTNALKSGTVQKNSVADETTAEIVYWEPITPYVTKDAFVR